MENSKTFYLKSGKTFSSLKGLARELMSMPVEVYNHHVGSSRNDFAIWAKFSLGNENLAKKIDGQINKVELELEILRHIVHEAEKKPVKKKATKKVSTTKKTAKKVTKKITEKTNPIK